MNTPSQVGKGVMSSNELDFIVGDFTMGFFVMDLSWVYFEDRHVVVIRVL